MKDILEIYSRRCAENGVLFTKETQVLSYDDSTLFCPAGMQKYKSFFKDPNINRHQYKGNTTLANVQPCIRLNDIDSFGDGSHLGVFNMLGMFSFRDKRLPWAVDFWWKFLLKDLGIKPTKVTIHPDKYKDNLWRMVHDGYFASIEADEECKWSDGDIGGYCTEFYVGDLEIGNIVYPLDCCIDVGFGLERLESLVNNTRMLNKIESLQRTIEVIISNGITPAASQHGYILRKLLRMLVQTGGQLDHKYFWQEYRRQEAMVARHEKLKSKHRDKSPHWWFDTHGIDINLLTGS